jgi:hypothetical protein
MAAGDSGDPPRGSGAHWWLSPGVRILSFLIVSWLLLLLAMAFLAAVFAWLFGVI